MAQIYGAGQLRVSRSQAVTDLDKPFLLWREESTDFARW